MLEYPLFVTQSGKVLVSINNRWVDGENDQYASCYGMPVNRQGIWLSGHLYYEELCCSTDVISQYCHVLGKLGKSAHFLR